MSFTSRKLIVSSLGLAAALAAVFQFGAEAPAGPVPTDRYRITITNATRGQIFSPPLAISHNSDASLFQIGEPASAGLALLAEDGDPSLLAMMMAGNPNVSDVRIGSTAVMPGNSLEIVVSAKPTDLISVTGMLVSTNDAIFAVRSFPTPAHGGEMIYALAYDAGSEANNEDCAYIPGPPCGNPGMHDPAAPEGFVHVHAGIHGIQSLDSAQFDWRGPVAVVRIERM